MDDLSRERSPRGEPPVVGLRVFLDFDGTLVRPNTAIELVSRFAPNGARLARDIDAALHARRITLREAWAIEVRSLPLQRLDEMRAFLRDSIDLRTGARELLDLLADYDVPTAILSGGLDAFIRPILDRERIDLPIISDSLRLERGRAPRVDSPFEHPTCRLCGVCKAGAIQRDLAPSRTVFVGDGSTDRFAAEMADLVFARHRLREYCQQHQIRCYPFEDLIPVARQLRAWLEGVEPLPPPRPLGRRESACPISREAALGLRERLAAA